MYENISGIFHLMGNPKSFPIIFLLATSIGLSNCNDKLSTDDNLTGEKICDLVPAERFKSSLNYSPDIKNANKFRSFTRDQYLEASSIIFGLARIANRTVLSQECFKDLKTIEQGILNKEPWAIKVLDSSGQKEPGFIWGHDFWLGSLLGCQAAKSRFQITLNRQLERSMKWGIIDQTAPFEIDYRVVYMTHNSPWQVDTKVIAEKIIHIGLCLPTVCSSSEVIHLTQTLMDSNTFEESDLLELRPEVMYVKDLKLKDSFFEQKSLKILTACLGFTLVMFVLAWVSRDETKHIKANGGFSKFLSFIRCFDLTTNTRKLFTTTNTSKPAPNSIPVLNGLRSVTCFWIMTAHVMFFTLYTVNNKTFIVSKVEDPLLQTFSVVPIIVDVFFAISGFLQAYNFLRNEKKMIDIRKSSLIQNTSSFGKSLLHRYFRLAPLELCLIPIVALFTSYIEDTSIFHITNRDDQHCSKYWWVNVLFIQNFFYPLDICLNWTWSLACDMQFYCLTSAILFVYAKHPKLAKSLAVIVLTSCISYTYITGIKYSYQFALDVAFETMLEMYTNPFVRIVSYVAGSIGGWFLAQNKGSIQISSTTEKNLWNLTTLLFIFCIFSQFKKDLSAFSSITLLIASRLAIAFMVSWMSIASATGRGTSFSRFLEGKTFEHINRVSYAIYLLNPLVLTIVSSLSQTSIYLEPLQMFVMSIGFGVVVYLTSVIFSLAFEIPYNNLSSMLSK